MRSQRVAERRKMMAQKEYKQLSCRDAGGDCDFMVRAETEDEVMSLAGEHACRVHNMCEMTPELKSKTQASTTSVWCDIGCHDRSRDDMRRYWYKA